MKLPYRYFLHLAAGAAAPDIAARLIGQWLSVRLGHFRS
jgi:hypothetical protein